MADVELDYEYLTQRALRRVVKDVLNMTAELGATPGNHHFYIEFETGAFGVSMPDELRDQYPQRMTIVLQHQFANLVVTEDNFAMTLWFKGKESRLVIPFDAVSSFADPSVHFGLRFMPEPADAEEPPQAPPSPESAPEAEREPQAKEGADVVRLDSFRKK